jgi:pyruvate dehydrogenase E2 component (dihydrolipoamide acetyltransferase)
MFEVAQFAAIVTPPQVAILATGRAIDKPVVRRGKVVVRRMMAATISADHRALDGASTSRFLGTLKGLLEEPEIWAPGAS